MAGLQDDLKSVLRKIEEELSGHGLDWRNVLYVHLYISDMNEFAVANDTYVNFITQEKCPSGVPSRSTIELPLPQVGLGKAYIEVLVTKNQEKRVLHVQSISCWAPSCIGPYSQVNPLVGYAFLSTLRWAVLSKINLCNLACGPITYRLYLCERNESLQ